MNELSVLEFNEESIVIKTENYDDYLIEGNGQNGQEVQFHAKNDQIKRRKKIKTCQICGKKLSSSGLYDHINSVHRKIRYACPECPLMFTVKQNTYKHLRLVHKKTSEDAKNSTIK